MIVIRISRLLIGIFLSYQTIFTQGTDQNKLSVNPRIGWDLLRNELYFTASVGRVDSRGPYYVSMDIGINGYPDDVRFFEPGKIDEFVPRDYLDSSLVRHIGDVFRSERWKNAGTDNNSSRAHLEIVVLYKGADALIMDDHGKSLATPEVPIERIRNTTLIK